MFLFRTVPLTRSQLEAAALILDDTNTALTLHDKKRFARNSARGVPAITSIDDDPLKYVPPKRNKGNASPSNLNISAGRYSAGGTDGSGPGGPGKEMLTPVAVAVTPGSFRVGSPGNAPNMTSNIPHEMGMHASETMTHDGSVQGNCTAIDHDHNPTVIMKPTAGQKRKAHEDVIKDDLQAAGRSEHNCHAGQVPTTTTTIGKVPCSSDDDTAMQDESNVHVGPVSITANLRHRLNETQL